jgi:hypothetical protein
LTATTLNISARSNAETPRRQFIRLKDRAAAQWKVASWTWSGAGAATGVLVSPKPGSDPDIDKASDVLVGMLNTADIASAKFTWPGDWDHFAGMLNGPPFSGATAAPIRIIIGTKPQ